MVQARKQRMAVRLAGLAAVVMPLTGTASPPIDAVSPHGYGAPRLFESGSARALMPLDAHADALVPAAYPSYAAPRNASATAAPVPLPRPAAEPATIEHEAFGPHGMMVQSVQIETPYAQPMHASPALEWPMAGAPMAAPGIGPLAPGQSSFEPPRMESLPAWGAAAAVAAPQPTAAHWATPAVVAGGNGFGDVGFGNGFAPQAPYEAQPIMPGPPSRAVSPAERAAVIRRADGFNRQGVDLMARGAIFSARIEYIRALRVVTQAIDAEARTSDHTVALSEALRALDESEDFVPRGTDVETALHVPVLVESHRTMALKHADCSRLTPVAALQAYYDYACTRFAAAAGGEPVAASALYGLGKVCAIVHADRAGTIPAADAKAMVFFQAAIAANPRQYMAANELAVLVARNGRHDIAKALLLQGLSAASEPALWQNLAVVHHHLGEYELSRQARAEGERIAMERSRAAVAGGSAVCSSPAVQWLDARQFAGTSQGPPRGALQAAAPTAVPARPKPPEKGFAFRLPWDRVQR